MPRRIVSALISALLLAGCLRAPTPAAAPSAQPSLEFSSVDRLTHPEADCPERPRVEAGARKVTVVGRFDIPEAGGGLGARVISADGHLTLLLHTLTTGALAMVETRCYRATIRGVKPGRHRLTLAHLTHSALGGVRARTALETAVSVGAPP